MKYSIVIPYRNRESHLQVLLPRLIQKFEGKDYEIIIAEQDETGPFCKTVLMNTAAKRATGDVLIFHDVDYYPMDDVSYEYDEEVAIYPVRKVIFLDENGQEMPDDRIPAGYRFFKHDVGNHSGGVVMVSKKNFFRMNGFNPSYRGWGKEDDDFLIRFDYHGIVRRRNAVGTFLALYHGDNAPTPNDPNFIHNNNLMNDFLNTYWMGPSNTACDVTAFGSDIPHVTWLKMRNCRMDTKLISLTLPTRSRVKSLTRTLDAIEATVMNPTQVEVLLRVDDDDTETLSYINRTKFSYDLVPVIKPRSPELYRNIGVWHDEMSQVARGKLLMWYGDDCIPSPVGWDTLVPQYQDGFGIVNTLENEGAPFNVVFFYTIKLYRTMQWLGTHPYNDRWLTDVVNDIPVLRLGQTDMYTDHHKDNPPSQQVPGNPIISERFGEEQKQWVDIVNRIRKHLALVKK